mmetsp:Transcript_62179/g.157408  ORF Transcript_62179/g.157408 Transcript_62179/m.157408 type:complete len:323 (-) Transcript_62179:1229-2197(-)
MEGFAPPDPTPPLGESLGEIGEHQMVCHRNAGGFRCRHRIRDALRLLDDSFVVAVVAAPPPGLASEQACCAQAHASCEEAPFDKKAQTHPQGCHDEEARDEFACDVPRQRAHRACTSWARADAEAKFLSGVVQVVVRGDVDEAAAQAVVRQQPREEGLEELGCRLQVGDLVLVHLHHGDRECGQRPGEDVGDDQGDICRGRDGEARLNAVHARRHASPIGQQEEEDGNGVAARVGAHLKDQEDEEANEERDHEVHHVPGVRVHPVHEGCDPGQQLLVLSACSLLMDQVHHKARWDEAHCQQDSYGHGEVCENLAAAGHLLLE